MADKLAMITLRVDQHMKTAFERIAEELDLTTSQMLRQYIRRMVEQHAAAHAQGALELEHGPTHQPAPKKPAKGQKMASTKPANWKKP